MDENCAVAGSRLLFHGVVTSFRTRTSFFDQRVRCTINYNIFWTALVQIPVADHSATPNPGAWPVDIEYHTRRAERRYEQLVVFIRHLARARRVRRSGVRRCRSNGLQPPVICWRSGTITAKGGSWRRGGGDKARRRTPLALATSADEGSTWRNAKLIKTARNRGFYYTAFHGVDDSVLLAYSCGNGSNWGLPDSCIRRVTLDWIYG